MYIERVPNRNSPPAVLLRESYREGGKVRKRTIANLSKWPDHRIEALRAVLRGAQTVTCLAEAFEIERSLPHGHVAAVLGCIRRLRVDRAISSRRSRSRDLVVAMIASRIIAPASKLATAGSLGATCRNTLSDELSLGDVDENELYEAMDWLHPRQEKVEKELARRHLEDGSLVLYDLTSSYFEGKRCPLAKLGHSRDGNKDKLQITIGLICDAQGRPISVEVYEGNASDPATFSDQVIKIQKRFGLNRVVFVGDRGMITSARIREDLQGQEGLRWITALRSSQIRKLVNQGTLQLSVFDESDLGEVTSPDYPGERLIACRNPLLAEQRRRTREELLEATERELEKIATAVARSKRPLRGRDEIGLRVGRVIGRFKMAKHFVLEIEEASFKYHRDEKKIAEEQALDGIDMIRTSVQTEEMETTSVVQTYKNLSRVERAFRTMKTIDLKIRPIYHRLEDRVRAHVFLCMPAYYVEWHMRRALAPLLFADEDPAGAARQRRSVVAPAKRSPSAIDKALSKKNDQGEPVQDFQSLISHLGTITKNLVKPKIKDSEPFEQITRPNAIQQKALDRLENTADSRFVPSSATLQISGNSRMAGEACDFETGTSD